jgi:hypothetical protein
MHRMVHFAVDFLFTTLTPVANAEVLQLRILLLDLCQEGCV